MIKKSLSYSIILLIGFMTPGGLFANHPGLHGIGELLFLVPATCISAIGALIIAPKIGKFLYPTGAALGTKACQSLGNMIIKSGNALINNSSTIGNTAGTIGSYTVGGAIGFSACFATCLGACKLYKCYKDKKREQEYQKRIKEEEKEYKDLYGSQKDYHIN